MVLIIIMIMIFTFVFFIISKSQKKGRYETDEYLPHKNSGYSAREREVTIETVSMKLIISPLILTFILISFLFLTIIIVEVEIPVLSDIGKEIMDDYIMWLMQFIFIQMAFFILFAIFKRIRITSENGVLSIDGKMQNIKYYQIKKIFAENNLVYLKTDRKLWILIPSTTEGLSKYPRRDVLKQQTEELNSNLEIIEKLLSNSDAEYKNFSSIRNLLFCFGGTFLFLAVTSIGILISKYY
ncbi:hypothetical protein [Sebaldella sp. S0638]|uniref:hypothetical protein n=1 Tax=Sebaldella sp. S0638 TaxID=2957809 RepID=UPI0020A0C3C4|nr:hypothetical protein [Sebaldella sp. S0638]